MISSIRSSRRYLGRLCTTARLNFYISLTFASRTFHHLSQVPVSPPSSLFRSKFFFKYNRCMPILHAAFLTMASSDDKAQEEDSHRWAASVRATQIPPSDISDTALVEHIIAPREDYLINILKSELRMPESLAKTLIEFGAVHVSRVMPDLPPNVISKMSQQRLDYYDNMRQLARNVVGKHERVVVETDDYVIVNKPPMVPASPVVDNIKESALSFTAEVIGIDDVTLGDAARRRWGTTAVEVTIRLITGRTHQDSNQLRVPTAAIGLQCSELLAFNIDDPSAGEDTLSSSAEGKFRKFEAPPPWWRMP